MGSIRPRPAIAPFTTGVTKPLTRSQPKVCLPWGNQVIAVARISIGLAHHLCCCVMATEPRFQLQRGFRFAKELDDCVSKFGGSWTFDEPWSGRIIVQIADKLCFVHPRAPQKNWNEQRQQFDFVNGMCRILVENSFKLGWQSVAKHGNGLSSRTNQHSTNGWLVFTCTIRKQKPCFKNPPRNFNWFASFYPGQGPSQDLSEIISNGKRGFGFRHDLPKHEMRKLACLPQTKFSNHKSQPLSLSIDLAL